jgi:2-iminoacetate synthase
MENAMNPTIDEAAVQRALDEHGSGDAVRVREILARARELQGLEPRQVATLCSVEDPRLLSELFDTARYVKETIYGRRLVLFAPLYISNLCGNECLYCAFRARNTAVTRRALSQDEIAREISSLIRQGHKRVLLVAGESYPQEGFSYVLKAIETIYSVKQPPSGEIRRVNVNVAPLTLEEFRQLKAAGIGTYQLFQETYHRQTYSQVHVAGKKRDYDWRLSAIDRAMESGIDDVGIGVLFGLADWKFEVLAMMQHIRHLESRYGVGPHTISVPRLEPATGSDIASTPPHGVPDDDFRKLVAILRMAVPYTGIIMSTRETPQMRSETFSLGVSQISAGSRTNPGGYAEEDRAPQASQFSLGDHRPLDAVIADIASMGYIPSFCTGCYRLGRTGADFMDLARPGDIKEHCDPNAVSTFLEYLQDYASDKTREAGEGMIERTLGDMSEKVRTRTQRMIEAVREGKRDVYC